MTLGEKQRKFSKMLAELILWAYDHGYEITIGEVFRTKEQAALNASRGKGIKDSLHCYCLAADLNLFKDGMYLTKTEEYKELGEHWEGIGGTWGGRFRDGNHFSIEHEGKK